MSVEHEFSKSRHTFASGQASPTHAEIRLVAHGNHDQRVPRLLHLSALVVSTSLQVWSEEEEEQEENGELKGPVVFCVQAEHAGTRTYYFGTDGYEEQKEWIAAMSQAAEVTVNPSRRCETCSHRTDK